MIASFPEPAEADYCAKGGNFGPHTLHENRPGAFQSSKLVFATYTTRACGPTRSRTSLGRTRWGSTCRQPGAHDGSAPEPAAGDADGRLLCRSQRAHVPDGSQRRPRHSSSRVNWPHEPSFAERLLSTDGVTSLLGHRTQPDQSSALDIQGTPVGEESWRTACVDEDDIFVALPAAGPHECDQAGQPFARIDRVEHKRFKRPGQLDGLDRCIMRNPVGGSSVAGDDLHVRVAE